MSATARPFSNGTEYTDWGDKNCDRCQAVACGLQQALRAGYVGDGTIEVETAEAFGGTYSAETHHLTMPRVCGRFERPATCERVTVLGRVRTRCANPAIVGISEGGYTYSACEGCAQEYYRS